MYIISWDNKSGLCDLLNDLIINVGHRDLVFHSPMIVPYSLETI